MHLRRAKELMPNSAPVGDGLVWAEMQYSIAVGHPNRCLELAEATMAAAMRVDPLTADEYLHWAARAAADLAERADDTGGSRRDAIAWLERIEVLRGHEPSRFQSAGPLDMIHPALRALYAAERGRCHGDRAAMAALWEETSEPPGVRRCGTSTPERSTSWHGPCSNSVRAAGVPPMRSAVPVLLHVSSAPRPFSTSPSN
jgi:hypothetical protein